MLQGVLIPEFGDLILRVWGQREIVQRERVQSSETRGGTALPRSVEGLDTVLIESRGTVAFCFEDFKESCVWMYWYCDAVSQEF